MDRLLPVALGFARNGMAALGAWMMARGYSDAVLWQAVTGFVLTGLGVAFGYATKAAVADQVQSLVRSGLSVIVGFMVFRGWLDAGQTEAIVAGLSAAGIALWSAYVNAGKGAAPTGGGSLVVPFALILLVGLGLGGCNRAGPLDPAVIQSVEAGVANAADKARVALNRVCQNYQTVDLVFDAAATIWTIPPKIIATEQRLVALLDGLCASPPDDPVSAWKAAQSAFTQLLAIRDEWRKPAVK